MIGALLLAAAALPALASAPLAKKEFARPPYAGAYEPQGVDERGLWMQADEEERVLRDTALVDRDPAINAYLRSVLCRTIGFDRCQSVRIYLIKESTFNASMTPNGTMRVHTGLLARIQSEAELAAVLGHEFAHFELRHGLAGVRAGRRMGDVLSWVWLAGAATNQPTGNMQTAIIGSYFQFSRAQETAADLLSEAYIRGSPYKSRASRIWQRVLDEDNALRKERRVAKNRRYFPSLVETHPTNLQRIAYFTKLEQEAGDAGEDGADTYRQATAPLVAALFEAMIKGNQFAAADYAIRGRGDALGWDGQMLTLRAELYRLRANPRDLATARTFFEKATTYPDAPPESWRGLGLTALRLGEPEPGRAALAEYLKRRPDARDAASIKPLLEN